jgi:LacI family transcriptional regulator
MAPKFKDVAANASVSIAAVSRVLSGHCPVQADLRWLARTSAAELGYHPNVVARPLRPGKTRVLGIIVPSISNPFFPVFVRGMSALALLTAGNVPAVRVDRSLEASTPVQ